MAGRNQRKTAPEQQRIPGHPKPSKSINKFKKGEEIGEFNLGSTIVIAFEAPKGYQFPVGEHDIVRLGQSLVKGVRKRHSMPNIFASTLPQNPDSEEGSGLRRDSGGRINRKGSSFHGVRNRKSKN